MTSLLLFIHIFMYFYVLIYTSVMKKHQIQIYLNTLFNSSLPSYSRLVNSFAIPSPTL